MLQLEPTSENKYPLFVVPDLTQDERFAKMNIVTGPPHFKFYAGMTEMDAYTAIY